MRAYLLHQRGEVFAVSDHRTRTLSSLYGTNIKQYRLKDVGSNKELTRSNVNGNASNASRLFSLLGNSASLL
jgi:hypothetical protein